MRAHLYSTLKKLQDFTSGQKARLSLRLSSSSSKVKIVAIAKNESAYLPEWIFHHLYFGFDEIEIHTNRCSDNTADVASYFREHPKVTFIDADNFFENYPFHPQMGTYRDALPKAKDAGFSHVLFIDIDEFWTPINLEDSIHDCIKQIGKVHSIAFEWANKVEPVTPFGPAIEAEFHFEKVSQVKSLLSVTVPPRRLNPHNVVNPWLEYNLADGRRFIPHNEGYSKIRRIDETGLKPYFITHRYYRSEKEYIALLGRGRPKYKKQGTLSIKSNRKGFCNIDAADTYQFPKLSFQRYRRSITTELLNYAETGLLEKSQASVEQTYTRVIDLVAASPIADAALLKKALTNVSDSETLMAYKKFLDKLLRN